MIKTALKTSVRGLLEEVLCVRRSLNPRFGVGCDSCLAVLRHPAGWVQAATQTFWRATGPWLRPGFHTASPVLLRQGFN